MEGMTKIQKFQGAFLLLNEVKKKFLAGVQKYSGGGVKAKLTISVKKLIFFWDGFPDLMTYILFQKPNSGI